MYETIKRLHTTGKITADYVRNAVTKGWITSEQANDILEASDGHGG